MSCVWFSIIDMVDFFKLDDYNVYLEVA